MLITGHVALVTGAGGMLGFAAANRLYEAGASLVIADLVPGRATALLEAAGMRARFIRTDVTQEGDVIAAVRAAQDLGDLRIIVNCAGAGMVRRTLSRDGQTHDVASFRQMLELNTVGTFMVMAHGAAAMAALEPLADNERGVVINTASLAGLEGSAGQIAYGAAKAAVAGMTLPAARDLASVGVRVMAIAPGAMLDPGSVAPDDPAAEKFLAGIPHPRRFGHPDDFALLVTQLVEHPYLNGSVIRLDGGARLGMKQ